MKPAAGTAAPEAITPLMKARREVGLRAKPVNTPSAGMASVVDPPLSDISVLPSPCRAVGVSRDTYARTCQLSRRHAGHFCNLIARAAARTQGRQASGVWLTDSPHPFFTPVPVHIARGVSRAQTVLSRRLAARRAIRPAARGLSGVS